MEKKQYQAPLNIDEQIENLKSLNLIITDEEKAKQFLNDVSYFRFVKAYSIGLKPKNGNYFKEITFEQLIDLYLFNCNFRQILFPQIEIIEINLRCRVSNYFGNKYGIFGYESSDNFSNYNHHQKFIYDIEKEIENNSNSLFVANFKKNYEDGKIPFYALIELFSFGMLSKFYKNMKNEDKKIIAKSFNVGHTYLESWVESISFVRNICAHYGRLYNVNLAKTPIMYKEYNHIGNLRIYSVLICMKHLLPNDSHWCDFVDTLEILLEKYPCVKKELMGFPEGWKDYLTTTKHK